MLGNPGGGLEGLYKARAIDRGRVLSGIITIVDKTTERINEYTKGPHCSDVVNEIRSDAYTRIEDFLKEYADLIDEVRNRFKEMDSSKKRQVNEKKLQEKTLETLKDLPLVDPKHVI